MEIRGRNRSRDLFMCPDIIFDISLRLSVKSLTRFKTTCKLWNSIVSEDPNFAELHHKRWIQKARLLFQPSTLMWRYWIFEAGNNGVSAEKLQRLPFKFLQRRKLTMFKHSSGALLLFETQEIPKPSTLSVYDNISGNQIQLPGLPESIDGPLMAFLTYDVSTEMHKVLVYAMKLQNSNHIDSCCITSFCNKTMASENVWRMMQAPVEGRFTLLSHTIIKDRMYWLVRKPTRLHGIAEEKFIKPFDIAEEKFLNTIRCPDEISKLETPYFTCDLLEIRGVLGFMLMTYEEFQIRVLTDSDNSSWNLLHKVSVETMFGGPLKSLSEIVFVLEKIKGLPSILLQHKDKHYKHYWYEMNGKKVKELDVEELKIDTAGCLCAWIP